MKSFKHFSFVILLLASTMNIQSQTIVNLEDGKILKTDQGDRNINSKNNWIESKDIKLGEIWIYQAPKSNANGMAVLICPGGGYGGVAFNHEGIEIAQWLNTLGITGAVLKYRMPNGTSSIPLKDAYAAIKYIQNNAEKLSVDKGKIGIAGFSAGGHLAASVSNLIACHDEALRPKFSILFYPVITMGEGTHLGSRNNLLGENPSEKDIEQFSIEKCVNKKTPPTILLYSEDDTAVPAIENSINYRNKLLDNHIPVTVCPYPTGGHGWGMHKDFTYNRHMLSSLKNWIII